MSILFSGDFHASTVGELFNVTKKSLKKRYGTILFNDIHYHIILGDGGFMWPNNEKTDAFNYECLSHRLFPILCVLGNHEPIYGKLPDMPLTDIGIGEGVYQINEFPFTAYLQRGKIYTIDGFKILVLGGALSIDKDRRTPGKTWWPLEYWTQEERTGLFALLEKNQQFDCVLSHTGPHTINQTLFYDGDFDPKKYRDEVAFLNDRIRELITFNLWWCGHWHRENYFRDTQTGQEYYYLYRTTKILDKVDNRITVYNEYEKTHS